jgi:hypothetical protein
MLTNAKFISIIFIIILSCQTTALAIKPSPGENSWSNIMRKAWNIERELYEENELLKEKQLKLKQFHFLQKFIKIYPTRANPLFINELIKTHPILIKEIDEKCFYKLLNKLSTNEKKTVLLNKLCQSSALLQQQDKNNKLILDKDIELIKKFWNKFKRLHNYNWLDVLIYPFDIFTNESDLGKIRNKKPLNILLHPDHYNIIENRQKITTAFVALGDSSRPEKSLDFIVDPIIELGTELAKNSGFIACNAAVITAFSLPSLMFPDYFKTQKILRYEEATQDKKIEIAKYSDAIINHQNAIKKHENLIKKVELNTKIRNQKIKALLNSPGNLKN